MKITPAFVLVAAPERMRLPAEVQLPAAAAAAARIQVSERKPKFEKRILEERLPITDTHVGGDWFALLDVGLKDSGIFYLLVWVCFHSLSFCFIKCLLTNISWILYYGSNVWHVATITPPYLQRFVI